MKRYGLYLLLLLLVLLYTGCSGNSSLKTEIGTVPENSEIQEDGSIRESGKAAEKGRGDKAKKEYESGKNMNETEKMGKQTVENLSGSEMKKIKQTADQYYSSIGLTVIQMIQMEKDSSLISESENDFEEIAVFEVLVKNEEAKRYLAVGSNNRWKNCTIVNEGY